jgi:hypothetical protein
MFLNHLESKDRSLRERVDIMVIMSCYDVPKGDIYIYIYIYIEIDREREREALTKIK